MNNKLKRENLLKITAAFILSMLIFCTVLFGNSVFARASESDVEFNKNDFTSVALSDITNTSFDNTSGDMPYTPSGWTETTGANSNKGNAKTGVIDLAQYNTSKDNLKNVGLNKYPEYASDVAPEYPSEITDKNNKKFLMVNTTQDAGRIIGYKSSDFNLSANKYYLLSVWVKTGSFTDNTGASVRLNGLGGNYAFSNINTVQRLNKTPEGIPVLNKDNYYGWVNYSFYVATGALKSYSASLTLAVGDYYMPSNTGNDKEFVSSIAKGYAFFDEVAAYEISATDYNLSRKSLNHAKKNIDLNLESAFVNDAEEKAFSFERSNNWTAIGQPSNVLIKSGIISESNEYGLDSNPKSSTGLQDTDINSTVTSHLDNVLLLTSYSGKDDDGDKKFDNIYTGVISNSKLNVERYKFYRLSFWAYTENIGGTGASVILHTNKLKSTLVDNDNIDPHLNPENYESYTVSSVSGDSTNGSRFGWKEYAFYIQGSVYTDYNFYLTITLGNSFSETGSGNALFHNIRFDSLTNAEYTENSANGTAVTFDSSIADDTGVSNGRFMSIGGYNDYRFPLVPASWTYIDAASANISHHSTSTDFVNNDDIISGIIATDEAHFNSKAATDYKNHPLLNPLMRQGHALLIGSKNRTAIGYRSSEITVTAATTQQISVRMRVDKIDGYGASLVLKNGNDVISTIENITSTTVGSSYGFNTFSFYVEGGAADSSLTVEIWLGLTDRHNNSSKLSSGYIYVESVSSQAAESAFATYKSNYDLARRTNSKLSYAAYSFAGDDFGGYDNYDPSFLKFPYDWSLSSVSGTDASNVRYGIFNARNFDSSNGIVPASFVNSKDAAHDGVFMMRVNNAAAAVKLNRQTTLMASSHYKISVKMRAEIAPTSAKSIGAGIHLTGTDFKFENIGTTKNESILDDPFKTFSFYVATGATDSTVGFSFSIGDSEYTSNYCSGTIYVNDIIVEKILVGDYDNAVQDKTTSELLTDYIVKANLGAPASTDNELDHGHDDDGDPEVNWWLVPSILGSAALLLALLGVVIRKVSDNLARRRLVKYDNTGVYDRRATLNTETETTPSGKIVSKSADRVYEEFDDVLPSATPAPAKKHERVTEEHKEEKDETVEQEPTDDSEIIEPVKFIDEFDD